VLRAEGEEVAMASRYGMKSQETDRGLTWEEKMKQPGRKDFVSQVKEPKPDFFPQREKERGNVSRLVEERDRDYVSSDVRHLSLNPRESPSGNVGTDLRKMGFKTLSLQGPAMKKSGTNNGKGDMANAGSGDRRGKHHHVRHVEVVGHPWVGSVSAHNENAGGAKRVEALDAEVNESGLVTVFLMEGDAVELRPDQSGKGLLVIVGNLPFKGVKKL